MSPAIAEFSTYLARAYPDLRPIRIELRNSETPVEAAARTLRERWRRCYGQRVGDVPLEILHNGGLALVWNTLRANQPSRSNADA